MPYTESNAFYVTPRVMKFLKLPGRTVNRCNYSKICRSILAEMNDPTGTYLPQF